MEIEFTLVYFKGFRYCPSCDDHYPICPLGVPLETLTVYQTAVHPDVGKNLTDYFAAQVKHNSCYVVQYIKAQWLGIPACHP